MGTECPVTPRMRTAWSTTEPHRTAAHTPSGTPRPAPSTMAKLASSSVAGKARRMSSITGLAVSTEVPKSPCSMRQM